MFWLIDKKLGIRKGKKCKGDIICKKTSLTMKQLSKIVYILTFKNEIIISANKSIDYVIFLCLAKFFKVETSLFLDELDENEKWLVKAYKAPLKVIFCGDRNSSICFEEQIEMELSVLPPNSTVIHGGCKGIDSFVEDLCKLRKINTKQFPISKEEWNSLGKAAGPLRNKAMLEENPDYVIAFHPDILFSKGTKNMVLQTYSKNIPVYIHDLKRKSKFKGDFESL